MHSPLSERQVSNLSTCPLQLTINPHKCIRPRNTAVLSFPLSFAFMCAPHMSFRCWCVAPAIVTLLIVIATCALLSGKESVAFLSITVTICAVVPAWKFVLQRYKRPVKGPWDPFRL
mmetsp:Transcript_11949/g.32885  ORF Transcript_11949/g.32885 Transcript_11949/m.32885 type:complete len:117 (+) Transcript_11949:461-811(+)